MSECGTCGREFEEHYEMHREWCEHVSWIVEQAESGEFIHPDAGTGHQLAEAIMRLASDKEDLAEDG